MNKSQEELEKILSQVLMKHHDDISTQDGDAIAEAVQSIINAGYVKLSDVELCEEKIVELLEKVYGYIKGYRVPEIINAFRNELRNYLDKSK